MSELIAKAIGVSAWAHRNQHRKYNGEPYIVHPIRVMEGFHRLYGGSKIDQPPEHAMAAAVCHDVLEDTDYTAEFMRQELGDPTTDLVIELTDVSRLEDGPRDKRKAMDRAHLAKASMLAQYIKVSDILDNSKDIGQHDHYFALNLYIPECLLTLNVLQKVPQIIIEKARSQLIDIGEHIESKTTPYNKRKTRDWT